jgi:alpha-amylase/alpha-mannosidase (GH57 family)
MIVNFKIRKISQSLISILIKKINKILENSNIFMVQTIWQLINEFKQFVKALAHYCQPTPLKLGKNFMIKYECDLTVQLKITSFCL